MNKISRKQIIVLHELTIDEFGGLHGIRDEKLLDSALNAPFQTFDRQSLYPTIVAKAASLCYGLINNHAFHDGNKRIGVLALVSFPRGNHLAVEAADDEWIELGLDVASGKMEQKEIMEWIVRHIS